MRNTLIYAYENVPFYREKFDKVGFTPYDFRSFEELESLPILDRQEAIKAGSELFSTEENLSYYETFTGGSSGQALRVLLDKSSIYKERAFVCHYLASLGYDPLRTKTVALFGHNKDSDYYYSPLKNEIVISPFRIFANEQIGDICRDIQSFGASFLMGYPSAIRQLAQRVAKNNLSLRFQQVVFYAENYEESDVELVREVFGCECGSYYGHTERAVFAEIHQGNCTFNDAYGYTELLPTETPNEFQIVCTGFISRKMPLIRYATDDRIIVGDDGKWNLVGHKQSEVCLIAKNGARIFKGAMTLHVEELKSISRYQYFQDAPGRATLKLMAEQALSNEEMSHLRKYLDRRTEGLLEVDIEYVDNLELTARGKERWAICTIPQDRAIDTA